MHSAQNMVGECKANYDVSLFRRYFRMSKHTKPGFIKTAMLKFAVACELKMGVVVYA